MKKMKLKKKKKVIIKFKFIFLLVIFFISLYYSFKYLMGKNYNLDNKKLVNYMLEDINLKERNQNNIKRKINNILEPYKLLNMDKITTKTIKIENNQNKENSNSLIYIYNSHQTEEYAKTTLAEYSVVPTVVINNYIMKDMFEKNNLKTLVEERSIKEVLNLNNWNYANSYRASRVYLEDIKKNNTSLKYFIDIHRDSLPRDKTTIEINGKSYAKVIFLIGLENSNYESNLKFTEEINNKINSNYPGLSKGIYKKGGRGVNGVYNQDFSPYTILIEIGGYENTTMEVMNTTLAVSKIISEVILENEQKEYS